MLAKCHQLAPQTVAGRALNLPIGRFGEVTFRLGTSNDRRSWRGVMNFPVAQENAIMIALPTSIPPVCCVKERLIFSLGGKVAGRGNSATGVKKDRALFTELGGKRNTVTADLLLLYRLDRNEAHFASFLPNPRSIIERR